MNPLVLVCIHDERIIGRHLSAKCSRGALESSALECLMKFIVIECKKRETEDCDRESAKDEMIRTALQRKRNGARQKGESR